MPSKRPDKAMRDIILNVARIKSFVAGKALSEFERDIQCYYAVVRALEIISEASRKLPDEMKGRMGGIDWKGIAAVGNVYRHNYESVDPQIVWAVVATELDQLQVAVTRELAQFKS
jgi:uncharacterized protein with HEPN domain